MIQFGQSELAAIEFFAQSSLGNYLLVAVQEEPASGPSGFFQIIFSGGIVGLIMICLLYTSPSPRDKRQSRMPSSA